jgi:hypothetical protein
MGRGANCKLRAGGDELPLVRGSGGLQSRMPGRAQRVAILRSLSNLSRAPRRAGARPYRPSARDDLQFLRRDLNLDRRGAGYIAVQL